LQYVNNNNNNNNNISSFLNWLFSFQLRVLQAVTLRTAFDPDEYWQSLEIAHRIVFGYGFVTWEWQASEALRGVLHPLLFALPFAALRATGTDSRLMVWLVPRLVQGVMAALSDFALATLVERSFTSLALRRRVRSMLLCSWFAAYCMSRTYANCLETLLVVTALALWRNPAASSPRRALAVAALACLVRPTAFVYFVLPALYELRAAWRTSVRAAAAFARDVSFIAVVAVLCGIALDSSVYAFLWPSSSLSSSAFEWRFSLLNFARFNVAEGGSAQFGTHPWHWYVSNALPTMLLSYAPFLPIGVAVHNDARRGVAQQHAPLWLVAASSIALHSLLPHKEFRFVLPAALCLLPYCAIGVSYVVDRLRASTRRSVWIAVLLAQLPLAFYFGAVHQRAPLSMMYRIGALHDESCARGDARVCLDSVDFLTPCHSTPFYAYTHEPPERLRLRGLQCAPPVSGDERPAEDAEFFSDPVGYLERAYHSADFELESVTEAARLSQDGARQRRHRSRRRRMPAAMVFFEPVLESVDVLVWLEEHRFDLHECFFHAHLPVDSRHGRRMCIFVHDRVAIATSE
jgi:phosphatidylinositol glycan class B